MPRSFLWRVSTNRKRVGHEGISHQVHVWEMGTPPAASTALALACFLYERSEPAQHWGKVSLRQTSLAIRLALASVASSHTSATVWFIGSEPKNSLESENPKTEPKNLKIQEIQAKNEPDSSAKNTLNLSKFEVLDKFDISENTKNTANLRNGRIFAIVIITCQYYLANDPSLWS